MITKFVKFDYENYTPAPKSEAQIKRDEEHAIYNNVDIFTKIGRAFGMQKTFEDDKATYAHYKEWTASGHHGHQYKILFSLFAIISAGVLLIIL